MDWEREPKRRTEDSERERHGRQLMQIEEIRKMSCAPVQLVK